MLATLSLFYTAALVTAHIKLAILDSPYGSSCVRASNHASQPLFLMFLQQKLCQPASDYLGPQHSVLRDFLAVYSRQRHRCCISGRFLYLGAPR